MTIDPGDTTQARALAERSASRRRKLTVEDVEAELGELETPDDAKRWLRRIVIWSAGGLLRGVTANACASLVREWLKAQEIQDQLEQLRARVRELTHSLDQRGDRELSHEDALAEMSDDDLIAHFTETKDKLLAARSRAQPQIEGER